MDVIAVLVVDKNADDASLISESLSEEPSDGFSIKMVNTLGDAISVMHETHFDVVLLGLTLPDSSGLDTVRQLAGLFPEIPIIVLSEFCNNKTAEQSVHYGAQDYLEKTDFSSLWPRRSIRYAIERKRNSRQRERLLADLSSALEEIEVLHRIIPICAYCRKIRNDNDEWGAMAEFLQKQIGNQAKRDICPKCRKMLYSKRQIKKEV